MDLTLATFAIVVFVTVATPGPTVILALTNGSRFSFWRAGAGIFGAALSDIVLITCAALGLGALLAASAVWFGVVKWLGVAYLVWLGIRMLRSAGEVGAAGEARNHAMQTGEGTARRIFRKSFLVAVTNPKGYLFFAAFLPQFVDAGAPLIGQYALLALVFVAIDVLVMAGYAALGANAMRFLRRSGAKWLERGCGLTLLGLAAALAGYRRVAA